MSINPTHVKLEATAKRLIAENGTAMQLWREVTTGPDYDPVITIETSGITAVRASFTAYEVGDGSRIKSTDLKLLMSSDVDPRQYQKVIDGTDELQIIDAQTIVPGDTTILYKVQVRL